MTFEQALRCRVRELLPPRSWRGLNVNRLRVRAAAHIMALVHLYNSAQPKTLRLVPRSQKRGGSSSSK